MSGPKGTQGYRDVWYVTGPYKKSYDVYSFGVVAAMMATSEKNPLEA